jgi:HSP20 family protein
MNLIHYHSPRTIPRLHADRWATLRDDINTLFELPFGSNSDRQTQLFNGWTPALDLYADNENVIATVELPGMRKEEIEISLHDGTLTISGERKDEHKNGSNARTERFVGKFRRTIALPTGIETTRVSASYKDGILTVTMPKTEEAKPKQIPVTVH